MQVLIAEDSPVYRALIGGRLRSAGYVPVVAEDGEKAWSVLSRPDCPKLVVMDWMLPSIDGIELCRRIRAHSKAQTYVIVVSGKTDQKDRVKAMEAGASDYLTKPFDVSDLEARLLVGRRVIELSEQLQLAKDATRYSETHDALTGLMTRTQVLGLLGRELDRAKKNGSSLGVMLADIDQFRGLNENMGRSFGDHAIKEIARRLRSKLTARDGIGRYGDDEFLIILRDADAVTALVRADGLQQSVVTRTIVVSRIEATLTVSIGVALAQKAGEYDLERVLTEAENGLRHAKQNGRNRVEHLETDAEPVPDVVCVSATTGIRDDSFPIGAFEWR